MTAPRHRAREVALQILYRFDVAAHAAESGPKPEPQQLLSELNQHFDHFGVDAGLREFAAKLVAGTLLEQPRLDGLLERHASNWKVGRMGFVDRSLLRMAIYELTSLPETPPSVVIDEAIELAKQFATEDTPAFINGILDAVRIALQPGQAGTPVEPKPAGSA
jgi:N utilization substance protein B